MKIRTSTIRRLFFVFVILFVLMGSASFITFKALSSVRGTVTNMVGYNRELRTTLALATAVRDQYAHEAHTIILGDASHLGYHEAACRNVARLTEKLTKELDDPEAAERVATIARATKAQQAWFQEEILPAVLEHDAGKIRAGHDRLLQLVGEIEQNLNAIVATLASRVAAAEKQADRTAASVFFWLLASHGLSLTFAVAAAWYLGRSIARPLARLGNAAQQLAQGDLDTVVELHTDDEFATLADQFNTMTRALKQHQKQKIQQEKLAAVGRLAAGVAHEINNPLGVILGYVRLMKEQADANNNRDIEVIEEEAVRAQEIVEGLLNLARPVEHMNGTIDLQTLCLEVTERVGGLLGHAPPVFHVEGAGVTSGNEQAIRQVLTNVVKNAGEASGPDGRVMVRIAQSDDGSVTVSVDDTGPGLSQEVRERLGEPFFTTKPRGTGLGIATSRAILESHGGRIEATNLPGGGARFTVVLPSPNTRPGDAAGIHPGGSKDGTVHAPSAASGTHVV